MWIIGSTLFALLLEIFSVLLNNANFKQFIVLHKLVNMIGFIVTPCIPFLGYIFIKEWVNRHQLEKIKTENILLLPLFINGILALVSYNGVDLFHITNENIYERGPLFFILPSVSYIFFVYNLYFIYKQHKKLTYSEITVFSLFYIVPAIFTAIQLKYSSYLTIWNSAAIIIVITYVFILNDQAYRDSLTGLGNRLSYEHYAQNIAHKKINKIHVVYIDLDEFKTINDQFGHYEGDKAIRTFANILVQSFPLKQNRLIRLGGDEFIVLLEEIQQETVTAYIQELTQNIDTYNNMTEKPYKLRFSYGMACFTSDYDSLYQLFERVDQMMYEQKQSRKRKLNTIKI
jgi:diguanylate cyclase (GGDEF)-like protein